MANGVKIVKGGMVHEEEMVQGVAGRGSPHHPSG